MNSKARDILHFLPPFAQHPQGLSVVTGALKGSSSIQIYISVYVKKMWCSPTYLQ